jgi:predicted permease
MLEPRPDWRDAIRAHLAAAHLAGADAAEVAEELRQHLDDHYDEARRRGADIESARRGALAELGEGDQLPRRLDAAVPRRAEAVALGGGSGGGVRAFLADLRIGARLLRRSPGFTAVAVFTLALGIGANTTVFAIVNSLLLRPMPGVARPAELALVGRTQQGEGFDTFSYPDFLDYQAGTRTLSGLAAYHPLGAHLSTGGASDRVRAALVSGSFFRVLGVTAALGRTFLPEEDGAPNAHPVVVLGHGLWQRRFGGDPGVVGRTVVLNAHPYTVVGVAARGFVGVEQDDPLELFVPLAMAGQIRGYDEMLGRRDAVWLQLFGRRAAGVPLPTVESELRGIARRLEQQYPESNRERGVAVADGIGFDPDSRQQARAFTGVLFGVVALVLLIACANVANLLLARASARRREISLRASLGASRWRLVRQLLAEGLLLAGLAAVVGLALGAWTASLVGRLPVFVDNELHVDATPDARLLGFTLLVALASALLFGLPAAFRASRVDLVGSLKAGAPGSGDARSRVRGALLVGQLALSLVLLAAAGLFLRTLGRLRAVDPGFAAEQVLVARVDVGLQGYDEARGRQFYAELVRRAAALPGARAASLAFMIPLGGGGWDTRIFRADVTPAPDAQGLKTDQNAVEPAYFRTMGMTLTRGRNFTQADREGAPKVAVVNEAMARALWPGESPLGKRFRAGREGDPVEVIGVVRSAKYRSLLESERPFLYRPFAQSYMSAMTLHVAAAGDPGALRDPVRRLVRDLDADLPIYAVQTLAERLDESIGAQRTAATMVGAYGALALLVAAVGLYGAMAYSVSRRTREIGVRMALGARESSVLRGVLAEAGRLAATGAVLGLAAAIPATRLLRSQLFGVSPGDPLTLIAVAAVLGLVSLAAAYLPARRATRVDPVVALRAE